MKTLKIPHGQLSERQLDELCRDLSDGAIMIWPTDTLYAIACDALNPKAIEKVCALKKINPGKTNLSIICSSISQAAEYARIDDKTFRLLRENTPGPYTFICPAASVLPRAFKGRKLVGIRISENPINTAIVERLGHPVLTTSIEFDDDDYAISPSLISEAYDDKVDIMIEATDGDTEPSTVIDCTGSEPEVIREGKGLSNLTI